MPLEKLPIKISAGLGLSMIDRAVKEFYAKRCALADLKNVRSYFERNGGLRCLYCGDATPTRWDHLHPVSRGDDTVPGNLVPACGRCDDSKQDRDIHEWAASKSKHRPAQAQVARILDDVKRYQNHFSYAISHFEKKLDPAQADAYKAFQKELTSLRTHLQAAGLLKKRS